MINVAVIGTGHLGSIHAKLWMDQEGATLRAVVDPDEQRGKATAELHGATWHAHIDDLADIDAVTIAAPTSLHHALAMRCLEKGYHMFIEKPVTATYDEARELIAKATTKDLVVQVGHVERFNPAVLSLAPYDIKPLFIEGHRMSTFKPRAIDVSVVHDLMIHDIDLLLWMTGSKVVDVQATGVAVLTDTPDICNARITFENGAVANLTASRISVKPMRKLRVFQRDTYLSLDLAEGRVEMFRLIDQKELEPDHQLPVSNVTTSHGDRLIVMDQPKVEQVNAIAEEQRQFLKSIREGSDAPVTLREGAEAVRVAEMIEDLLCPDPAPSSISSFLSLPRCYLQRGCELMHKRKRRTLRGSAMRGSSRPRLRIISALASTQPTWASSLQQRSSICLHRWRWAQRSSDVVFRLVFLKGAFRCIVMHSIAKDSWI